MFCLSCGTQNADAARFCGNCGAVLTPPQVQSVGGGAAVAAAPAPAAPEPRLASLGDRLIAVILDSAVLSAAFAVIGMWVSQRMGGLTAGGFSVQGTPAFIVIGANAAVGLLYYLLLEALFGATLGKAIIGVQVRRKDGTGCGFAGSLVRNLLRVVDGIIAYLLGFFVAVLSKQRQRIGDHAAGTVVVERPLGQGARAGMVVLWLALLAGGFVGAYLLHFGA